MQGRLASVMRLRVEPQSTLTPGGLEGVSRSSAGAARPGPASHTLLLQCSPWGRTRGRGPRLQLGEAEPDVALATEVGGAGQQRGPIFAYRVPG